LYIEVLTNFNFNLIYGGQMKAYQLFILIFSLIFTLSAFGQETPTISFEDIMISAEEDFQKIVEARELTALQNIPHTIYLPEGIFIEARGIEDGKVVYAVYNDLVNIYSNGETAFWEEINNRYDLGKARLHFVNHPTINPTLGLPKPQENPFLNVMLLVPNWTNDGVSTFDATTGEILNLTFIVDPTNLSSPKEANLAPWGNITVSDQLDDGVLEYDTAGTFIRFLAPAGGVNNAILNNVRGHNFRPNGNLVVANSDATNPDAVAEFDQGGNYLGNFIANGSGGLDGPFDIIFRTSDCLVSASSSDAVHRYDLNGTYLDDFVSTTINFPQQVLEMANGDIAVAGFSPPSGVYIYSSTGTLLRTLSVVTGVRSVYELPNGNLLTTSGTSMYKLDENTGAVLDTIATGLSFQYISLYDYSIVPVELTSFSANISNGSVVLNWSTSTETNNSGFEVLRLTANEDWQTLTFVPGFGTTTEPKSYSYSDETVTSGTYSYKLKQIDYDGSYSFSDVVEVEISIPTEFALEQNYPNPFNPSTSIQFSLPVDANVTIGVYNLVGEKVADVVSSKFSSGKHNVNFNASGLTSGVYFYRIDVTANNGNNFTSVKKMTLLK
jgi:hypothetical protein